MYINVFIFIRNSGSLRLPEFHKQKMKETTLLKIALICALIGLVALYFISEKIEIAEYKPMQLNKGIGSDVVLKGSIAKITQKGKAVFIDVDEHDSVQVVFFTDSNVSLSKGNNVEIIGKIQEYNGKNEIVAQKIRVVR